MTAEIRDSYDANAELYASLFLHDLDRDVQTIKLLATFAELAAQRSGQVVDLGCGPGSVVNHLRELGLDAVGYDISPGQIEQARIAFPDLAFHVGDMAALDGDDATLGGIVARYSIIHTPPEQHAAIFAEWLRALEPGAPLFVSFFGSRSDDTHGTPFGHTVVTAYELRATTVAGQLEAAGFTMVEIKTSPIPEGGRPYDHATLLARKQTS